MNLSDVAHLMQHDLDLVEERLFKEARVDYPVVGEIVMNLLRAGGKRLRPLLVLLAARPFTYDIARLTPAAAGVELLHNASLIHDDTVDHAETRRGQPTLNTVVSSETVILLGDYLFARSAMLAAETMSPRVVAVFADTLAKICDGQLSEIFNSRDLQQTVGDYKQRIYGKTASLFAASAEMGAILSDAPEDQIATMRRFGGNVGMAFQIIDDVLDLREASETIGKPAGIDLRQGTVTLPTMLFFEQAGSNGRYTEVVRRVVRDRDASDEDFRVATRAIRESGALDDAVGVAEEYVIEARCALATLPPGSDRDMLEAFALESLSRTS